MSREDARTGWDPVDEIDRFADDLAELYGGGLQSLLLYGSVARGEAVEGVSDVNVLILLEDLGPDALRRGAPLVRRWYEAAGAIPLLFTRAAWRRSIDVFPLEVVDMVRHHRVVRGEDPLHDVSVARPKLRLQLEREIRTKLVQLGEGALMTADRPAELGRLIVASAPAVATYLRGLLELAGSGPVPASTPDAARRACALMEGVEPDVFLDVWSARASQEEPELDLEETRGWFDLLEHAAETVDRMEDR